MAKSKSLWLRLYTEILNDPKVQRLPDSLFRAYINFLCIAKEYSDNGVLPPKKDIAFFLRCPENSVKKFCDGLKKVGLLDEENDSFIIHGWNNRQYDSDNDPTANMRKRRQRERDKTPYVTDDVTDVSRVTSRTCHENVTRTEIEKEIEKEREREIEREQKPTAASAPSVPSPSFQKPEPEETREAEKKKPFGTFKRVLLTPKEYDDLVYDYGTPQANDYINRLDCRIEDGKEKVPKSAIARIRDFMQRDKVPKYDRGSERRPGDNTAHESGKASNFDDDLDDFDFKPDPKVQEILRTAAEAARQGKNPAKAAEVRGKIRA